MITTKSSLPTSYKVCLFRQILYPTLRICQGVAKNFKVSDRYSVAAMNKKGPRSRGGRKIINLLLHLQQGHHRRQPAGDDYGFRPGRQLPVRRLAAQVGTDEGVPLRNDDPEIPRRLPGLLRSPPAGGQPAKVAPYSVGPAAHVLVLLGGAPGTTAAQCHVSSGGENARGWPPLPPPQAS